MNYHSFGSEPQAGGTGRATKFVAIFAASLLLAGCADRKAQAPTDPLPPGPDQLVHLVWMPTNEWKVSLNNDPPVKPDAAKTKLDKGVGPTKFIVDITNYPTATFKDPGGLSVWTGNGAKSQPKQGINSPQILGPIVTDNGRKLVFYDLNQGNPVFLNYALHFNGGIKSVDPIIDNGGNEN